MRRRLYICIPMFVLAIGLLLYSLRDANGFNMIWRYFAWANQTLAVFTLWAITVFLAVSKENLYHHFDTGTVYDMCMFYLYMYCSRRIGAFACSFLWRWYSVCSSCGSLVLYLDKQAKTKKIIRMKKIRKSTGVALAFLIYVSVTAAYLLPRNTEVSPTEK